MPLKADIKNFSGTTHLPHPIMVHRASMRIQFFLPNHHAMRFTGAPSFVDIAMLDSAKEQILNRQAMPE